MSPNGAPSQSPRLSRDCGTTLGWCANTTATPTGLRLLSRTCRSLLIIWFRPHQVGWDETPLGLTSRSYPRPQGRRCAPTLGSVSERRWRSRSAVAPRRRIVCLAAARGLKPTATIVVSLSARPGEDVPIPRLCVLIVRRAGAETYSRLITAALRLAVARAFLDQKLDLGFQG